MQQRGVIILAIIAALAVAGYIWYTLGQRPQSTDEVPTTVASPSPEQTAPTATLTPAEFVSPLPSSAPATSQAVDGTTDVNATAGTGTRENVIVAILTVMILSGWYLYRQIRPRAASV